MLAQLGRHQNKTQEVPGPILTGGEILAEYFCFYTVKSLMPILSISSSL